MVNNERKKIVTIVGARPQFIKLALLSRELKQRHKEILVHTGQHYDENLSDIFFKELRLRQPDHNLNVISNEHGEQTARMLKGIENILLSKRPDIVMVYGDTNSTLAGALAAAKLRIPVAHIEAGLRSFNNKMPEEINRVIVDHISTFLFCPTKTAVINLRREGIKKNVFLVGDVMYDNILYYLPLARKKSAILTRLKLWPKDYYLLTIHRAENTQELKSLKSFLIHIDGLNLETIFPIHPRTRKFLGGMFKPKGRLRLIPPVSYLDMLILEENAKAIFTDSGGVQKEAYILKVPCFTVRQETEWVETLKGRCNRLIDIKTKDFSIVSRDLAAEKAKFFPHIFGNGNAAKKIVKILSLISS